MQARGKGGGSWELGKGEEGWEGDLIKTTAFQKWGCENLVVVH
jgi:hypothetical protein